MESVRGAVLLLIWLGWMRWLKRVLTLTLKSYTITYRDGQTLTLLSGSSQLPICFTCVRFCSLEFQTQTQHFFNKLYNCVQAGHIWVYLFVCHVQHLALLVQSITWHCKLHHHVFKHCQSITINVIGTGMGRTNVHFYLNCTVINWWIDTQIK